MEHTLTRENIEKAFTKIREVCNPVTIDKQTPTYPKDLRLNIDDILNKLTKEDSGKSFNKDGSFWL